MINALLLSQLDMVGRSGRVKRYHSQPAVHTQTVGEHTYGVMWLVLLLTRYASRDLMVAALMHDAPEYYTGDVPAPTKRLAGMKAAFDNIEDSVFKRLELQYPQLSEAEARTLKMADVLEGALFCAWELNRGNREIHECLYNYISYADSLAPDGAALEILNYVKGQYAQVFGKYIGK
jgi:5'-deoxynucleotidase YfbR-like HD superfamily hydrolase